MFIARRIDKEDVVYTWLTIWCCHCSGLGCFCGTGLIPGPGNSTCHRHSKKAKQGVPVVAQWSTNPTRNHEVAGSIPALAQWVNDPAGIAVSCGVGCRRGLAPTLLWLWRRPVATALIPPLAWEPPYAMGSGPRKGEKTKKFF